mmetsp:Transcript_21799/g.58188  ORF Transcript_21799/g.58188 Transcript_21799/m.58188 type:complete len:212 (+) Transcript_21799:101-736(+)
MFVKAGEKPSDATEFQGLHFAEAIAMWLNDKIGSLLLHVEESKKYRDAVDSERAEDEEGVLDIDEQSLRGLKEGIPALDRAHHVVVHAFDGIKSDAKMHRVFVDLAEAVDSVDFVKIDVGNNPSLKKELLSNGSTSKVVLYSKEADHDSSLMKETFCEDCSTMEKTLAFLKPILEELEGLEVMEAANAGKKGTEAVSENAPAVDAEEDFAE